MRYSPTTISSTSIEDVHVRRWGEQRPRLLQPAQVGDHHQERCSTRQIGTRSLTVDPDADWMASTPPAMDTATVRM